MASFPDGLLFGMGFVHVDRTWDFDCRVVMIVFVAVVVVLSSLTDGIFLGHLMLCFYFSS